MTFSLKGNIQVPGDKSISHRAVMMASLTDGVSTITGLADNQDVMSTKACFEAMGVDFSYDESEKIWTVTGKPSLEAPVNDLDAGNSGTTMRLISGILAAQFFKTIITGDQSLCKRPMGRIIKPLVEMAADIKSFQESGFAPLEIFPVEQLKSIDYTLPKASAQIKSAVLLAGLFTEGGVRVIEPTPSRDHTERMFEWLGFDISVKGESDQGRMITLGSKQINQLRPADYSVCGDFSSAAFFIAAVLCVPESSVVIQNIGLNPLRTGLLEVLSQMGANIDVINQQSLCGEPVGDIGVRFSDLSGDVVVEGSLIPRLIDEIPILSVLAVFNQGKVTINNAGELRVKESDRISAIENALRPFGVKIITWEDGLEIIGSPTSSIESFDGVIDVCHDHRIAMAMKIFETIVRANGKPDFSVSLNEPEWMSVSYPVFIDDLSSLMNHNQ